MQLPQLNSLERSGLIELAQAEPELAYLFRHALVQDAAYHSLLKNTRRKLHRSVGETLERLYPDRLDELAATLAYHFGLAEAHVPRRTRRRAGAGRATSAPHAGHEKALDYFTRAANRARTVYANAEAVASYRAAIEQAGTPPSDRWHAQLAQLHEQLGDVLELTGKPEEARAAHDGAFKYVLQTDHVGHARLHRKIGSAWRSQFCHPDAAAAYDRAEQTLGAEAYEPIAAWWQEWIKIQLDRADPFQWIGYWPLLGVALHKDQIAEGVRFARAMLEPTQQRLPDALNVPLTQAVQLFEQGQVDSARSSLRQAIATAEQMQYL